MKSKIKEIMKSKIKEIMKSKIKEIMERCIIFTFDNFKYSYAIVGLLIMHNIHIFAFLMIDIFMIVVTIGIKLPLPLKKLKLDFAKAHFFIILIWSSLVFFHGYFVIHYTVFPFHSGEFFLIYPECLSVLRHCGSDFTNYISYNIYMDTLDLLEIWYLIYGEFYIVFF